MIEWVHDGNKLRGTSNPTEIMAEINLCTKERVAAETKYYLLSGDCNTAIISNVSPRIYKEEDLWKYVAPSNIGTFNYFLSDLQDYIDAIQDEFDASDRYEDGKLFHLNQCYTNSKGLFHLVTNLSKCGAIKPKHKIKIVLGYMASKIPFGTNIGDIVVENNQLYLHDWHVWNYINDFLIDLSIFKNGNLLELDSNVISWGTAKDHVFVHPPPGVEYFGSAYDDMERFEKMVFEYFKQ